MALASSCPLAFSNNEAAAVRAVPVRIDFRLEETQSNEVHKRASTSLENLSRNLEELTRWTQKPSWSARAMHLIPRLSENRIRQLSQRIQSDAYEAEQSLKEVRREMQILRQAQLKTAQSQTQIDQALSAADAPQDIENVRRLNQMQALLEAKRQELNKMIETNLELEASLSRALRLGMSLVSASGQGQFSLSPSAGFDPLTSNRRATQAETKRLKQILMLGHSEKIEELEQIIREYRVSSEIKVSAFLHRVSLGEISLQTLLLLDTSFYDRDVSEIAERIKSWKNDFNDPRKRTAFEMITQLVQETRPQVDLTEWNLHLPKNHRVPTSFQSIEKVRPLFALGLAQSSRPLRFALELGGRFESRYEMEILFRLLSQKPVAMTQRISAVDILFDQGLEISRRDFVELLSDEKNWSWGVIAPVLQNQKSISTDFDWSLANQRLLNRLALKKIRDPIQVEVVITAIEMQLDQKAQGELLKVVTTGAAVILPNQARRLMSTFLVNADAALSRAQQLEQVLGPLAIRLALVANDEAALAEMRKQVLKLEMLGFMFDAVRAESIDVWEKQVPKDFRVTGYSVLTDAIKYANDSVFQELLRGSDDSVSDIGLIMAASAYGRPERAAHLVDRIREFKGHDRYRFFKGIIEVAGAYGDKTLIYNLRPYLKDIPLSDLRHALESGLLNARAGHEVEVIEALRAILKQDPALRHHRDEILRTFEGVLNR